MIEKNFVFTPQPSQKVVSGSVTCQSPSNIALVKYWGKTEPQIPKNSSISFTLSNCHTTTTLKYQPKKNHNTSFDFNVFLDGQEKPEFIPKIAQFFERVEVYLPFIRLFRFEIHTENSFPHSSGIASSASGLSALSVCLMSLQKQIDPDISEEDFTQKASFLSRLGSGSAARSLEGPMVVWGAHPMIKGSNDLFGVKYPKPLHSVFETFNDTILLVDKGVKQVSSTVGHQLMLNHPFSEARFIQAQDNMKRLIPILEMGKLDAFIDIVEKEALSLHAMMLTSDPYFILMKPNTLKIIEKIWEFRKNTGSHICFTLDAGANVHVLYPKKDKKLVDNFIGTELIDFCQNKQFIADQVGTGVKILNQDL